MMHLKFVFIRSHVHTHTRTHTHTLAHTHTAPTEVASVTRDMRLSLQEALVLHFTFESLFGMSYSIIWDVTLDYLVNNSMSHTT